MSKIITLLCILNFCCFQTNGQYLRKIFTNDDFSFDISASYFDKDDLTSVIVSAVSDDDGSTSKLHFHKVDNNGNTIISQIITEGGNHLRPTKILKHQGFYYISAVRAYDNNDLEIWSTVFIKITTTGTVVSIKDFDTSATIGDNTAKADNVTLDFIIEDDSVLTGVGFIRYVNYNHYLISGRISMYAGMFFSLNLNNWNDYSFSVMMDPNGSLTSSAGDMDGRHKLVFSKIRKVNNNYVVSGGVGINNGGGYKTGGFIAYYDYSIGYTSGIIRGYNLIWQTGFYKDDLQDVMIADIEILPGGNILAAINGFAGTPPNVYNVAYNIHDINTGNILHSVLLSSLSAHAFSDIIPKIGESGVYYGIMDLFDLPFTITKVETNGVDQILNYTMEKEFSNIFGSSIYTPSTMTLEDYYVKKTGDLTGTSHWPSHFAYPNVAEYFHDHLSNQYVLKISTPNNDAPFLTPHNHSIYLQLDEDAMVNDYENPECDPGENPPVMEPIEWSIPDNFPNLRNASDGFEWSLGVNYTVNNINLKAGICGYPLGGEGKIFKEEGINGKTVSLKNVQVMLLDNNWSVIKEINIREEIEPKDFFKKHGSELNFRWIIVIDNKTKEVHKYMKSSFL